MIGLFALLLSQDPILHFEKYKAAYEPHRRCVLTAAKAAYPTGASLKSIHEAAERKCADARVMFSLDAMTIELDALPAQPGVAGFVGDALDKQLLFEIADDFVPRKK